MHGHRFASLVAAILTLMLFANRAVADFSGPYTFAPDEGLYTPSRLPSGNFTMSLGTWTLSGTLSQFNWENTYMIAGADEFRFDTGPSKMNGNFFENISLTQTIPLSGLISFDYSVSLVKPSAGAGDVVGYTINGQLTVLPEGIGSVNVLVNQGDQFGFDVSVGPQCVTCQPPWASGAALDVTNFIGPVPEPTTTAFVTGSGLAAVLVRLRGRSKRKRSCRS